MPILNQKKGVSHIKTLHTVKKKSGKNGNNTNFLDLYMLEKEKSRLMCEETNILNRLDYIQDRIKTINNIYEKSSHLLQIENNNSINDENDSPEITTIQIGY
ncbi:MAG: hypothetical protein HGA97_07295 [Chlorobiaceae bacterium]|jgi:hypothetical protein|nr:hypothetical protein [Chlorobiaceae bacterium]